MSRRPATEGEPRPDACRGPYRLSFRFAALILVYGASLLFLNLWKGPVLNYHEARYAQAAREMLARREWLIPTLVGEPRAQKPPLTYWAIAAAAAIFGSHGDWVPRLPSSLAALATALAVAVLSGRWFGARIGLLAGLIQVTSLYSLVEAQLADPDMLLCAAVSIAMLAFSSANVESPRGPSTARWLPRVFYLGVGLTFLIKGPIGSALIFPACLVFLLLQRDASRLRFFVDPPGLALCAALALGWPFAAYLGHPEIVADWMRENVGRFAGEMGHEPLLLYVYTSPWLVLPWTPFVVMGAASAMLRERAPAWRFLGLWFVVGLVLLSLSAGKHERYLTPVLPPLSVFAAHALARHATRRRPQRPPLRLFTTLLALGSTMAITAAALLLEPRLAFAASCLVALAAGGIAAFFALDYGGRIAASLAALFGAAWIVAVLAQRLVVAEYPTYYRGQTELARRIDRIVPAGEPLYLLDVPHNQKSQIAYYLAPPLVSIAGAEDLRERLRGRGSTGEAYVLAPQSAFTPLSELGAAEILDRCSTLRRNMTEPERLALYRVRVGRDF